jgi:hypothetical protein
LGHQRSNGLSQGSATTLAKNRLLFGLAHQGSLDG